MVALMIVIGAVLTVLGFLLGFLDKPLKKPDLHDVFSSVGRIFTSVGFGLIILGLLFAYGNPRHRVLHTYLILGFVAFAICVEFFGFYAYCVARNSKKQRMMLLIGILLIALGSFCHWRAGNENAIQKMRSTSYPEQQADK